MSWADIDGVHQDRVTLWDSQHAFSVYNNSQQTAELVKTVNLQEAADVDFVMRIHKDHILKEPEERPGVFFNGLQQLQNPVILKEQPTSALYRTDPFITTQKRCFISKESLLCLQKKNDLR